MNIEQIYPKDIRIKLLLLNYIYYSKNGKNINSLAQATTLERRTIYSYINEINDLSEKLSKEIAIIFVNNNYFFQGDKLELYVLKNSIINSSPITKLLYLLLTTPSVNVSKFCLDHFQVESTFKKHIKNINKFLEPFDVRIVTRKNELTIIGDEMRIRYYFASFYWKSTRGITWPFYTISENRLEEVVFSNIDHPFSYSKKKYLLYIIAINILRSKAKHSVLSNSLPSYSKKLSVMSNLSQNISRQLSLTYHIPSSEIEYIILLLHTFQEYLVLLKGIEIQNILAMFSLDMLDTINNFTSFIDKKHPKWKTKYDTRILFSVVCAAVISIDIFKQIHFSISSVNLLSYFKKDFPNLIPTIKAQIIQTLPNFPIEIQDALSLRFAQAYVTLFSPKDFEPEILIYLDTDLPVYVEKIIYNQITQLLCSKFKIFLTTEVPQTSVDIILSTAVSTNSYPLSKLIYIEDEISPRDQKKIIELCQTISTNRRSI